MNNDCFKFLEELQRRIFEQERAERENLERLNASDLFKTPVIEKDPEAPIMITDQIKKVIYNDPATIVYWKDGSKTVVQVHNEPFDYEKGLLMAMFKKMCGNTGSLNDILKDIISGATVTSTTHSTENVENAENPPESTESVNEETAKNENSKTEITEEITEEN